LGFDTLDPLRQEAISATDRSSNAALAASFNPESQQALEHDLEKLALGL
jgi:hypothetical protein